MTNKHPKAIKIDETKNATRWDVEFPGGKSYYVTTYPDSDLIFIETFVKRRVVAQGTAVRLTPAIRSAIDAAKRSA